jgi:hypothetical protein
VLFHPGQGHAFQVGHGIPVNEQLRVANLRKFHWGVRGVSRSWPQQSAAARADDFHVQAGAACADESAAQCDGNQVRLADVAASFVPVASVDSSKGKSVL